MYASNLMSAVFCILLIFLPYFNSTTQHYNEDYEDIHYSPVTSTRGNYVMYSEPSDAVFIKPGQLRDENKLEIFCTGSGEKSEELQLYSLRKESVLNRLLTEIINESTIRYITTPTEREMTFQCKNFNNFASKYSTMTLVVDGPPDVVDFFCISENLNSLVCSWTTTNYIAYFTLYMLENQARIICATGKFMYKGSEHFSCTKNEKKATKYIPVPITLHLLMKYCNFTYCLNKTYDFDHLSIVKLAPPELISIMRYREGGEKSVLLNFAIQLLGVFDAVEYRVEYKIEEGLSRAVTTSLLSVANRGSRFLYSIAFDLPCAGRRYFVNVSVRTKLALDDRYWSDRLTVNYMTPLGKKINSDDDAACSEEEIGVNPEIMEFVVKNFKNNFIKEQLQLKSGIKELKTKVYGVE